MRGYEWNTDFHILNAFAHEMMATFNVLNPSMVLGVVCNVTRGCVVNAELDDILVTIKLLKLGNTAPRISMMSIGLHWA